MISEKDAQNLKYFCECGKALPCLNCLDDDEIKPKTKRKNQIKPSIIDAWALTHKFDQGTRMLGKHCWKDATIDNLPTKVFRTRQQARDARKDCCYKKTKVVKVVIFIEPLK